MSSHIEQLDLSHHKISRYLPKKMNFSSSNSPKVNFAFNQLKGPIPIWSGVTALYLRYSLLSGTLPANIGEEMSHLKELDLSNDLLNRSIPLSITRIQNLSYLDLSKNHLTGEIPVFGMGMQRLEIIDLSNNSLSGGIPTSICSLPSLFILELSNNKLSADLSSAFQNCTSLQTLSLGNKRFFGLCQKRSPRTFLCYQSYCQEATHSQEAFQRSSVVYLIFIYWIWQTTTYQVLYHCVWVMWMVSNSSRLILFIGRFHNLALYHTRCI